MQIGRQQITDEGRNAAKIGDPFLFLDIFQPSCTNPECKIFYILQYVHQKLLRVRNLHHKLFCFTVQVLIQV